MIVLDVGVMGTKCSLKQKIAFKENDRKMRNKYLKRLISALKGK